MAAGKSKAPLGASKRILRIGVILGGKIIEERLLRTRQTITIGQSQKNTFCIPIEGLPREWPIFVLENDSYGLQFMEDMDGRISSGNSVESLEQMRSSKAQKRGKHWFAKLDEKSRGKLVLGEMTLLFQFVTAPPLQPRPRLPASVRGTLADRVDPRLAVILGLSLLLHFGVALYAYQMDRVVMTRTEELARQFEEDQFQDRVVAVDLQDPIVDDSNKKAEEVTKEDTKKVTKVVKKNPNPKGNNKQPKTDPNAGGGSKNPGANAEAEQAAVNEAIQKSSLVLAITGGEGKGSRYQKMSDIDQGAGLEKSLQNAKGSKIGTSGKGQKRARGQGSGKIAGNKGPNVGGVSEGTGIATKKEEKVSKAKFGKVDDLTDTTLDPSQVARLIKTRYLAGIKRCHEKVLKTDPTAQGRVNIRFTVGPTGKVTSAKVKGFNAIVDACIQAQANRWRFGAPKDDDGKPTRADFSIPLILKPGS